MPAQNNYLHVGVLFLVFSLQLTSGPSAMGANGILPRRGDLGVMVSAALMDHAAIEDQFQDQPRKFDDEAVGMVIQWLQQRLQAH